MKGERFTSKSYGIYEVVEDNGAKKVKIRFLLSGYERICQRSNVIRGNVKDPYYPSVYGKGWIGEGKWTARVDGILTKPYRVWVGILTRCYSELKRDHWRSYREGVTVSEEFLDFQIFAEWFSENYIEGWDLDKDVISSQTGSKIYSRETCIFLPPRINKCFIGQPKHSSLPVGVTKSSDGVGYVARLSNGDVREYLGYFTCPNEAFKVYKDAKLKLIKELTLEYKDHLPERTFNYLLSYKID